MLNTYTTEFTAVRGFRRNFAHLADLSNAAIRMDVLNTDEGLHSISIEAVAELEAERFGELRAQRIEGIPALRRSVVRKGAVARIHAFFSSLPAGIARRDAIAAAVDNGFAYCTARTQYQKRMSR